MDESFNYEFDNGGNKKTSDYITADSTHRANHSEKLYENLHVTLFGKAS